MSRSCSPGDVAPYLRCAAAVTMCVAAVNRACVRSTPAAWYAILVCRKPTIRSAQRLGSQGSPRCRLLVWSHQWPYRAHSSAGVIQWPLSREQRHHRASLASETPAELLCSPFQAGHRTFSFPRYYGHAIPRIPWVTSKLCIGGGDWDGNKQVITRLGITVIQTDHQTAHH